MDKPLVLDLRGRPYGIHTPLVRRFLLRCMLIDKDRWDKVSIPAASILKERGRADVYAEELAVSQGRLAEFKAAQQAAWAIVEKDSSRGHAKIASELAGAMTVLDLLKIDEIEASWDIWFKDIEPGSVDEIKIELLNARLHNQGNATDSRLGIRHSLVDAWHKMSDSVYGDPGLVLFDFLGKIEMLTQNDLELLAMTNLAHTINAREEAYLLAVSTHLPVEDLLGAAWAAFWGGADGSVLSNRGLYNAWGSIENVTLALLCEGMLESGVLLQLKAPWEMVAGESN